VSLSDLGPKEQWTGTVIYLCKNPRLAMWQGLELVRHQLKTDKPGIPDEARTPFPEPMVDCRCSTCVDEARFQIWYYFEFKKP